VSEKFLGSVRMYASPNSTVLPCGYTVRNFRRFRGENHSYFASILPMEKSSENTNEWPTARREQHSWTRRVMHPDHRVLITTQRSDFRRGEGRLEEGAICCYKNSRDATAQGFKISRNHADSAICQLMTELLSTTYSAHAVK